MRLKTQNGIEFGWVMDDVISKDDCQQLIDLGKPSLEPSKTLEQTQDNFRKSSHTFLFYNNGNETVDNVFEIITNMIQVPLENCEGMQLVHYKPGQFYKPHWDYFDTSSDIHIEETRRGGQRTWTAFLYLNDVKEGGTTNFPNINMEVKPKIGRIVYWLNTLNGNTIEDSLHEAKPPIDCEKWGANIWVREKEFTL